MGRLLLVTVVLVVAVFAPFVSAQAKRLGPSASPNYLRYSTVVLADAAIKALPSVDVEVVPAPGANRVAVPMSGVAFLNNLAGAYTNTSDAVWYLKYGAASLNHPTLPAAPLSVADLYYIPLSTINLSAGYNGFTGEILAMALSATGINTAITLSGSGWNGTDLTGGHPANTLSITVVYVVLDLTTGALVPAP